MMEPFVVPEDAKPFPPMEVTDLYGHRLTLPPGMGERSTLVVLLRGFV